MDKSGEPSVDLSELLLKERGRDSDIFKQKSSSMNNSTSRVVRIFISSTFKDFYWEREILVKKVFPRLRAWCDTKNIFLIECDLRWGVPEDATGQEAVLTCMEEIERSREEMNGQNFFLGLIGHRYGWSPTREELSNFIMQRFSWIEGASMTLMEIVSGAIRTLSANCLFMIRQANFLTKLDDDIKRDFLDSGSDYEVKMNEIRKTLLKIFPVEQQVEFYSVKYDGVITDYYTGCNKAKLSGLDEFAEKVYRFFKKAIMANFPTIKRKEFTVENNEIDQHNALYNNLIRNAQGRSEFRSEMISKIYDCQFPSCEIQTESAASAKSLRRSFEDGNKIICLHGPPGIGKSTLMACLIHDIQVLGKVKLFVHFCGASITSKSDENIKSRISNFLKLHDEFQQVDDLFDMLANVKQQTAIFVDAIDEINDDDNGILSWLPWNTPKPIHFVVSCLDNSQKLIAEVQTRDVEMISVNPLTCDLRNQIVKSFFHWYGKKLDKRQMQILINHTHSDNALWLMQACDELRIHGDHLSLSIAISKLPEDLSGLNQMILSRLIDEDTSNLLKIFLQILYISRVGVWECDIRKLLATLQKREEEKEISQCIWNQIIRSLKPFVIRQSNPIPIIKFRHRIIKELIFNKLFHSFDEAECLHSSLADFYDTEGNPCYKGIDYAYHLYSAFRWRDLVTYLRSECSSKLDRKTRLQIMRALKCGHPMSDTDSEDNHPKLCNSCKDIMGFKSNRSHCFLCSEPHFEYSQAQYCTFHMQRKFSESCMGCGKAGSRFHLLEVILCVDCSQSCAHIHDEDQPEFESVKSTAIKADCIAF